MVARVAAPDTSSSPFKEVKADPAVSPLLQTPPDSNPTSQAKEAGPASESQGSILKKTSPDPEMKRKMQLLFNKADRIMMGYANEPENCLQWISGPDTG